MTIIIAAQTKEIKKGTLRIQKVLEKGSQKPYYIGTFKAKNLGIARVVIKRFSNITFKELESRI